MKTIYLTGDRFGYNDLAELSAELAARGIIIGADCRIGDRCSLGYRCSLGVGCGLGARCSLGDGCSLGYGCSLGVGCSLGGGCSLGVGCRLGSGCGLGRLCRLGAGCSLGDGCGLGDGCSLAGGCRLGDGCATSRTLIIQGTQHPVSWCGLGWIRIGCRQKPIEWWQNEYRDVGAYHGYTSEQILEYSQYIDMCATLQKTCE